MQWIRPSFQVFLEPKTNTTRTTLKDLFTSPTHMRNGPVDIVVLPVTGFIDLGSTTRPFAGTTLTFLMSNPHQVIFSTPIPIPAGPINIFVCGEPGGWQLVLPAAQSLPIWEACENYEHALHLEQRRLAAENNPVAPDSTPAVHPRGRKGQAVDNLEHFRVEYMVENLLQNFSQIDVSQTRDLPAPEQRQLIEGVVHTLTTCQDELNQALDREEPAPNPDLSSRLPPPPQVKNYRSLQRPLAQKYPYRIRDLCLRLLPLQSPRIHWLLHFHPRLEPMIDHYLSSTNLFRLRPYVLPLYIRTHISRGENLARFLFLLFFFTCSFSALVST